MLDPVTGNLSLFGTYTSGAIVRKRAEHIIAIVTGVHTCEKEKAITYISERGRRQRVERESERERYIRYIICTCKCNMKLGNMI